MSKLNLWNFKKQRRLRGIYTGSYVGLGKYRSTIFHIRENGDGKIKSMWGYFQIKLALGFLPVGNWVDITYLGIKKMKAKGKHKPAKKVYNFKISVRQPKKTPMAKGRAAGGKKSK